MQRTQSGFSIAEITVVMAVFAVFAAMALPSLSEWVAALRVEMAAGEMAGVLHLARIHSTRYNVKVGVKFSSGEDGVVYHALYRDGDGDGVRTADIESGVDPQIRPPRRLAHLGRRIRFGFPLGRPPRDPTDPRKRLDRLQDPVRFNRSDIASFNPRGTATPGSIYLTDGRRYLAAVRVNNRSGKISILYYDQVDDAWL